MTCIEVLDLIEPYQDSELAERRAAEVAAHVSTCSACAMEVARADEVRAVLRHSPSIMCPDPVWDAVLAQIERQDRAPVRTSTHVRQRRGIWPVLAMATVIAAIGGGAWIQHQSTPRYSASEIDQARQQVEYAFAVVARAGRSTTHHLQEHIGREVDM